jgi:replication factor A1
MASDETDKIATDEIDEYVKRVMEQAKDADEKEVRAEFVKYQKTFLVTPKDAFRSVLRKFNVDESTVKDVARAAFTSSKRVDRFSELLADDRNVTIEVKVVTYTLRIQTVRGEEKQVAFGWIEDAPYNDSNDSVRWDFKDWGEHHERLAPGSIVRLEGVSVNEWQGKKSININRSSSVVVLEEGGQAVSLATSDPISIEEAGTKDGFVTVVGRLMSVNPQTISKKDGTGDLDIVKGKIADGSGSIGFVSWAEFEHEVGTLLRIEGASIRRFRDTPELNIGDRTKVENFHDKNFASHSDLEQSSKLDISGLRDGSRDISITVQVNSWEARSFTNSDGEEKSLWGGEVLDPTGRCRMTAWSELPIDGDSLPAYLALTGVRVRAWQGTPDITVDEANQVEVLDEAPWDAIDAANHWVEQDLTELLNGGSKSGMQTQGTLVSIRSDCGIILRCPECRRVLRDGECVDHGAMQGNKDLRLRMVLDDGSSSASLLLNKEASENYLGEDMAKVTAKIDDFGQEVFVQELRSKLLGQRVTVRGRCLIDDQGAMLLCDELDVDSTAPNERSQAVRTSWGVMS